MTDELVTMGKAVTQPQDVQCWTGIIPLQIGNYLENLRKIIDKDRKLMGLVTILGIVTLTVSPWHL